jgi:alkylation response protein AidB-like acyl-CoA dehydrogenase
MGAEAVPPLAEEYQLLRATLRRWVLAKVPPATAAILDREGRIPSQLFEELGQLGSFGFCVPRELGGVGVDPLALALTVEELSRALGSLGAILTVHHLYCAAVLDGGGPRIHAQFLAPFGDGTRVGAFALTEPGAGSDAASITTRVERDGDSWVLDGVKSWVTNAPQASAFVVFATHDPAQGSAGISAFLVSATTPGLRVCRREETLGIRATQSSEVRLEGCRVPLDQILGRERGGFALAMRALRWGRLGIAAQALGIAQAALELALDYAGTRISFGKRLAEHQAIQVKLADIAVAVRAARLLVYDAGRAGPNAPGGNERIAAAKLFASEAATASTHQATQILGSYGFSCASAAERLYRDSRVTELYGGTAEIMRVVIARELLRAEDACAPRSP